MSELHLIVGPRRSGKSKLAQELIKSELNPDSKLVAEVNHVMVKDPVTKKRTASQLRLGLMTKEHFQALESKPTKLLKGRPGTFDRPAGMPLHWVNTEKDPLPTKLVMNANNLRMTALEKAELMMKFDKVVMHATHPDGEKKEGERKSKRLRDKRLVKEIMGCSRC